MHFADSISSSFQNIFSHKFRSILTLLAIVIGIFSVVIMFSSIYGIKIMIRENMEKLGFNNTIFVLPAQSSQNHHFGMQRFMYMQRETKPLTYDDYLLLEEHRSELEIITLYGMISTWQNFKAKENHIWINIKGTNADFLSSKTYPIGKGRFFNHLETKNAMKVCVLGYKFAEEHFPDSNPIGNSITIGTNVFQVVGILAEDVLAHSGFNFNSWDRNNDLSAVYIPLSTATKYLSSNNSINVIAVQSKDFASFNNMKNRVRQLLLRNHGMSHDFSFQDIGSHMVTITKEIDKFMDKWNLTLTAIASISLLVGALGLFSTMLISINEKMLEIGIRKSVGATPKDIFVHFLIEAQLLSLIGAIVGIILSITLIKIVSFALKFSFPIVSEGLLLGIGFAIAIGFVSGLYPAWKASGINPIEAVSYNE